MHKKVAIYGLARALTEPDKGLIRDLKEPDKGLIRYLMSIICSFMSFSGTFEDLRPKISPPQALFRNKKAL